MASVERVNEWYRIVFRYQSKKYTKALDTKIESEALRLKARLEENLALLIRGRLVFTGTDLVTFLLSDGRLNSEPTIPTLTLKKLFAQPTPWKEDSTQATEKIHKDHLLRLIGNVLVSSIDQKKLQEYVNARAREVAPVTIKKEIGTFSSYWNSLGLGPAATRSLKYPKQVEKLPFHTWAEIEKQGDEELWDCLFLTPPEIEELIAFSKENARPFVHAMIVFASHTGARRSEMIRSRKSDFDFDAGMITIREKKKDTAKTLTYRKVPMTPLLKQTMESWFEMQGGSQTFCAEPDRPLSPQLAGHHIRWLLNDSKWCVIRGWHVLRHSFITACVMKGIDQRMIDLWVGHTTDAMRRRYTHLVPSAAKLALESVFV